MRTEELLRDLAAYLMETARDLERKDEEAGTITMNSSPAGDAVQDPIHDMRKLARQIEVLDYNPLLFSSLLEEYDLQVGPLDTPLENVPLHVNDESPVAQAIVTWRLSKGV